MLELRPLLRVAFVALISISSFGDAWAQRTTPLPGMSAERAEKPLQKARRYMAAVAHPDAAEAAVQMLRAGGSAADAAIAAQLVLSLVEPQSSGLGGGAYLVHWNARSAEITTLDGRETAPATAKADGFMENGKPLSFEAVVNAGIGVGVPGIPRLLEAIHRAQGRLPWARLFEPALRLATEGFHVSPRLHASLKDVGAATFSDISRPYFFDASGMPHPIGHKITNAVYASTLRAFRDGGADALYTGEIARSIIAAASAAPVRPGSLTLKDFADYRIETRPAACIDYRKHRVCSMGPSSSGGIAIGQTLKMLERFDLGRDPTDATMMHLISEAEKLAYADRDRYIGDPEFVRVPTGMLDTGYLTARSRMISTDAVMQQPEAGQPPGKTGAVHGKDATSEVPGTSHLSVIDANGNAVSMTTTVGGPFGSRLMAGGFLLNNNLTDFSFDPVDQEGRTAANAVAPGKRPRSSMSPTLVFDPQGRLMAIVGTPGGNRIIQWVTKVLVALIDWRLDAQQATALPNFGGRGGVFELESGQSQQLRSIAEEMRARGHRLVFVDVTSGLNIIVVRADHLEGGSDPRREGVAIGD